jgi:DNA replication protein DnaC
MSGPDDFETFWQLYPRKVAKAYARKIFVRLSPEDQFAAIQALPIHIKYWKLAGRSWDYLPHASTWLSGECWADELEMPVSKTDSDWHRSTEGITRKAKEVGITPRPGEDWHSLKARILAKVAA